MIFTRLGMLDSVPGSALGSAPTPNDMQQFDATNLSRYAGTLGRIAPTLSRGLARTRQPHQPATVARGRGNRNRLHGPRISPGSMSACEQTFSCVRTRLRAWSPVGFGFQRARLVRQTDNGKPGRRAFKAVFRMPLLSLILEAANARVDINPAREQRCPCPADA